MYENFYGFTEKPFSMTPDAAFLYLGRKHSIGLSMLRYGLVNRAGITLLTGDIGTGKTTIVRRFLDEIGDQIVVGLISNTHESFGNLMQWVSFAFGLEAKFDNKAVLYERFSEYLIKQYAAGLRVILVVDEAQNLQESMLEELRLLTNINADKNQLLQLVLVGQPELRAKLRTGALVQFAQRVGVDYHLAPLDADETQAYIEHRLIKAGGDRELIDPVACRFLHYQCGGVPRLINSVCDTALVYGFAEHEKRIHADLLFEIVNERIAAGLFGVGNIAFERYVAQTPEKSIKKALTAARRRAASFLKRAHAELDQVTDTAPGLEGKIS